MLTFASEQPSPPGEQALSLQGVLGRVGVGRELIIERLSKKLLHVRCRSMAGCYIGQFKQLIILPKFHPKMPNPDWFHPKPHRKSEPTINMQYVPHEQ